MASQRPCRSGYHLFSTPVALTRPCRSLERLKLSKFDISTSAERPHLPKPLVFNNDIRVLLRPGAPLPLPSRSTHSLPSLVPPTASQQCCHSPATMNYHHYSPLSKFVCELPATRLFCQNHYKSWTITSNQAATF